VEDLSDLAPDAILSGNFSVTRQPEVYTKHINGVKETYARRLSPRKGSVTRSQNFKRWAAARAVFGSLPGALPTAPATVARPRPPIALQAGMLAAIGLSDAKFGRVRALFGGSDGPIASLSELRKARATLLRAPANEVHVDDSGAHRSNLRLAVQDRLGQLCTAGLFIERPVYDAAGKAVPKTRAFTIPAEGETTFPLGTPPENMLDVHLLIGLDKGGSPSSVKVVMGLHNQSSPHRLGNTLLMSVCPAQSDRYDSLVGMFAPHTAGLLDLHRRGVVVGGQRRAARIFVVGDWLGVCGALGHKGPNASLPCPICLGTKAPSQRWHALDMAFGSI